DLLEDTRARRLLADDLRELPPVFRVLAVQGDGLLSRRERAVGIAIRQPHPRQEPLRFRIAGICGRARLDRGLEPLPVAVLGQVGAWRFGTQRERDQAERGERTQTSTHRFTPWAGWIDELRRRVRGGSCRYASRSAAIGSTRIA